MKPPLSGLSLLTEPPRRLPIRISSQFVCLGFRSHCAVVIGSNAKAGTVAWHSVADSDIQEGPGDYRGAHG